MHRNIITELEWSNLLPKQNHNFVQWNKKRSPLTSFNNPTQYGLCTSPQRPSSRSSGLMSTVSLLFLALCVDTLVKQLLLVGYEELHRLCSEVHIGTESVLHLCIKRKLTQWDTTKDSHCGNSAFPNQILSKHFINLMYVFQKLLCNEPQTTYERTDFGSWTDFENKDHNNNYH